MESRSTEKTKFIIFAKKDYLATLKLDYRTILETSIKKINEKKSSSWLIHETDKPGVLNVASFDVRLIKNQYRFFFNSTELIHTNQGWIFKADMQGREITLDKLNEHEEQLLALLHETYLEDAVVYPELLQASTYYHQLPDFINQVESFLTCQFSKKRMTNPMILLEDITVEFKGMFDHKYRVELKKGQSYDQSSLIKLGLPSSKYEPNKALNFILEKIAANDLKKLQNAVVNEMGLILTEKNRVQFYNK